MAKDSLYFSHDLNARNDRKIAALVKKHKSSGYGIFWTLCEMLHEEGGLLEHDEITFGAIAKDMNEDISSVKIIVKDCVEEFKLFTLKEDKLYSGRVERNVSKRMEIKTIRSNAGKQGANAKQMLANAEQNQAKKERKKEKKEIRGVSFSADGLEVILTDGSKQKLGAMQEQRMKEGNYKPHYIKKGIIE